ncbi:response regulator transcription factor [Imperialibacter roseus]|uniref:Response regulator transcription factor n=1 Tax=Imperialibacter roseus TaxID=1324217 RepID=A0ABZ0IQ74_9BACT|nr:response regulator transcription factor [Imperialibacter roseus]WOK06515.1 response regulator transcription factor [Imperialibacter roseus]
MKPFSNISSKFIRKFSGTKKMEKVKVFLVDDHAILMDGVRSLLNNTEEYEVVSTASTAEDALKYLQRQAVDILISDYSLPGMDGLGLVKVMQRIKPEVKILIMSMHDEAHLVKEILKEGIKGYLLKKDSQKELIAALDQIRAGRTYLSNEINTLLIQNLQNPDEGKLLTEREREILKLIAKEYTNKDIAEELFISERTVETHRKNIFRKTKTNSLVGLIKFAYANNLV